MSDDPEVLIVTEQQLQKGWIFCHWWGRDPGGFPATQSRSYEVIEGPRKDGTATGKPYGCTYWGEPDQLQAD